MEKRYLHEERKVELHRAMQRLKPEYRQVLWLIYFEGMTGKETSRIMKKNRPQRGNPCISCKACAEGGAEPGGIHL